MEFIILIIMLLLCIFLLNYNQMKIKFVNGFSGVIFAMLLYYLIVPLLAYFFKEDFFLLNKYGFDFVVNNYYHQFESNIYSYIFIVFIGIVGFLFGYYINFISKESNKVVNIDFSERLIKRIYLTARFFLIFGAFFLIIFLTSVGGILNALNIAEETRGFNNTLSNISYIGGIAKLISRIVIISPILFLLLIILKDKHGINKIALRMYLGISIVLSMIYFFSYAGRTPLITFLLMFIAIYGYKYFKRVWIKLIIIGILCLPFLDILSNIFIFLNTSYWEPIEIDYANYLRQFFAPAIVLININQITDIYGVSYFKYYITDLLSLLPIINYPASYENTSQFFRGNNWRLHGGIPNDLFSYGFLQLKHLGVFLHSLIFGYLVGAIDKRIMIINNNKVRLFFGTVFATQIFQVVFSNDFGQVIQTQVLIWTLVILVFTVKITENNKERM